MLTNHSNDATRIEIDVKPRDNQPVEDAIAVRLIEKASAYDEWHSALLNALAVQGYVLDGRFGRYHVKRIDETVLSPRRGFKGLELALEAILDDIADRAAHRAKAP